MLLAVQVASLTLTAFLKSDVETFMVLSLSKAWKKSMTLSFRSLRNFCGSVKSRSINCGNGKYFFRMLGTIFG